MSAVDRNAARDAANLAALCRRLDRRKQNGSLDGISAEEGFRLLVEGARAAGQLKQLARATARLYAPAGRRIADHLRQTQP
ncbi:hypothetical protein [Microvirga massiliensis]|uniref:hypothetical protein n=1 Tax=Microvirga massiliensis TaxID=1033741 RepID=UPI00062B7E10|nr:hypothetical protein [Microvirga massiliensis]